MAERVIIAGTRTYKDRKMVYQILDKLFPKGSDVEVLSGLAKGPDYFGWDWAEKRGHERKAFRADWKNLDVPGAKIKDGEYGKYNAKAGIMRNEKMGDYCAEGDSEGKLVLFWDGKSGGTKHMLEYAIKLGIKPKIFLVECDDYDSVSSELQKEYQVNVRGL